MKKRYTADFETTPDPIDCRVWAWSICNIDDVNDSSDTIIAMGNSDYQLSINITARSE